MEQVLFIIIPAIVTNIITWLLSRRKYRAQSQALELDNVQNALDIYRDMILDLKKELENLREKIIVVVNENEMLGKQMEELRKELICTRAENKRLMVELKKNNIRITENET